MTIVEIILAACSALGITGTSIFGYKAIKKKGEAEADKAAAEANAEEWHLWREQVEAMNEQVRFKDERITQLLHLNAEKEQRFVEQTDRLRAVQDREAHAIEERTEALKHVAELEKENGELKVRLANRECVTLSCLHRDPPNQHTLQAIAAERAKQTVKKTKKTAKEQ